VWHALEEGDELPGGVEDRVLKAFRTHHYLDDAPQNSPRSLGYHLMWRKQKVRAEYRDLPQPELDALRMEIGREGITEPVDEKWITVGGDGSALNPDEVRGSKLLLHEATFLCADDRDSGDEEDGAPSESTHGHVHSTVEEALRVAQAAEVENLVLYHISTRYTDAEIRDTVRNIAAQLESSTRIWVTLPRRVHWNLLGEKPVWEPKVQVVQQS
jgi:ribonuclease BN (tRNA processing enzyme)